MSWPDAGKGAMSSGLSPIRPLRTLAENEALIERGILAYAEAGTALADIRDRRLYRDGHGTFEAYCRERWGLSRKRAYDLTAAAEVVGVLSPMGDTPPRSERAARELVPLRDDPERLHATWEATVAKHGPDPTAKQATTREGRE